MTYEEFIDEYGDMKVKFRSYYKYMFYFQGPAGFICWYGGNVYDIYKCAVEAGKEYTVKELEPLGAVKDHETLYRSIW